MKALLVCAILACACCGAPSAQGQLAEPARRATTVQEKPAPESVVVMSEPDYRRLIRMLRALTDALEQRNAQVELLTGKLKETCP